MYDCNGADFRDSYWVEDFVWPTSWKSDKTA